MTNDDSDKTMTNERRDAVREKAKRVNARIQRRTVARRAIIAVVIIAAVVAAGWWVWRSVAPELDRPVVLPKNISGDGIDVTSLVPEDERPEQVDEPFDVDVYVDYLDPAAGTIESELGPEMYEWVDEGVISLTYHPVSLRAGESNGTQYSTRAAGAVMCVVSESPRAFSDFNTALLTNQPEVSTEGHTDAELADIAAESGAEGVADCITDRTYAPWVSEATDRALAGSIPGTDGVALSAPVVVVDGAVYDGALDDAAEFSQFLFTLESERTYGETDPKSD